MPSGISIGIAADARGFITGVRSGVLAPLEGVEDALEDVQRIGNLTGRDLEDAFRDASREAEKFERANKELTETIRRESRKQSKAVRDVGDDGFDKAGDNVEEFKNEATQNFSEVASSFSGDVDDMVSGVQGLTGGLASALTPGIGIPVAIIGAVAATFFAEWQKQAAATEQRISDMYDDMVESGQTFLSETFIDQKISEIVKDTDEWNKVREQATAAGADESLVLRAYAGDMAAVNEVLGLAIRKRQDTADATSDLTGQQDLAVNAALAEQDELNALITALSGVADETDTAANKMTIAREAMRGAGGAAEDAAGEIGKVTKALDDLPDHTSLRLDVIPNMSEVERQIGLVQGRTITLDVRGNVTRIGNQVW